MLTVNGIKLMDELIAIIGLGYVGLPLACELSNHFKVICFDKDPVRIQQLNDNHDCNFSVDFDDVNLQNLVFTDDVTAMKLATFYIVSVPTPVDHELKPNFEHVIDAYKNISKTISEGNIVVLESTVSLNTTEGICKKIIESNSGLELNKDFYLGYSPERINPSFKQPRFLENTKVISSSCTNSGLNRIKNVYSSIFFEDIIVAENIKLAEACKLVENIQRDVNIALMNELSSFFSSVDVELHKVIELCKTKWNFSEYYPGLVGGHCISVDPYYLIEDARQRNSSLKLVELARAINKNKVHEVYEKLLSLNIKNCKVSILGVSYKENIGDVRNSQSLLLIRKLIHNGIDLKIHDPYVKNDLLERDVVKHIDSSLGNVLKCDVLVVTTKHDLYRDLTNMKLVDSANCRLTIIDLVGLFKNNCRNDFQESNITYIPM